jgi:hypothetical protein
MLTLLFWLFVAHAFGDYVFQTDVMSREKRRSSETELQKIVPWYYWLSAHALVHGGLIAAVTGSVVIGILETVAHWVIDFGKCEGWYGMKTDQLLHVLCKVMWFSIIVAYATVG